MTTVVVEPLNKKIYADSRSTITCNGKFKEYLKNSKKTYKSNCGKFILGVSGNVHLTNLMLKKFNITYDNTLKSGSNSGDAAHILVCNIYNGQVAHISITKNIYRTFMEINYFTGSTRITMGSGGNKAGKVWDKVKDSKTAIRVASFFDRYTDCNVQEVGL